jgi:hypothetical protein
MSAPTYVMCFAKKKKEPGSCHVFPVWEGIQRQFSHSDDFSFIRLHRLISCWATKTINTTQHYGSYLYLIIKKIRFLVGPFYFFRFCPPTTHEITHQRHWQVKITVREKKLRRRLSIHQSSQTTSEVAPPPIAEMAVHARRSPSRPMRTRPCTPTPPPSSRPP